MINPHEVQRLKQRAPLPIILGFIMLSLPWILVNPKHESLASVEQNLDSTIRAAHQTISSRHREWDWFEKFGLLQKGLQRIDSWLQPEAYLPQVIDQLHTMAGIFGVQLQEVAYTIPGKSRDDVARLLMQLTVRADYPGIRAFLRALEGFPLPLFPTEILATSDGHFALEFLYLFRSEK